MGQYSTVKISGKKVLLANIHLSSPAIAVENPDDFYALYAQNYRHRQEEYQQLNQWLQSQSTAYKLLLGDFNTPEVEPLFRDIRSQWADLYEAVGPGLGFNFPNSRHFSFPVITLDYILYQGKMKAIDAKVIKKGKSDHFAILGTLRL